MKSNYYKKIEAYASFLFIVASTVIAKHLIEEVFLVEYW